MQTFFRSKFLQIDILHPGGHQGLGAKGAHTRIIHERRAILPDMDTLAKLSCVALFFGCLAAMVSPAYARTQITASKHGGAAKAAMASVDSTPIVASSVGDFMLTAYAVSPRSTGKRPSDPDFGITYSGTRADVHRTVAVDPKVIPIGAKLYIEGIGWRVAEDTGGLIKGHHIDVLLPSDEDAIRFGVRRHVRVYIVPPQPRHRH